MTCWAAKGLGAMAVDTVAVVYSILGGIFMGSYPVPIKCDRVLRVHPHPVIFQCYKTFWVFVTGWFFLLVNGGIGFEFSWWAVLSAFCWVPSGLCTIMCTPLVGVGMAIVMAAGANSVLSFLVFWLIFGAKLVEHGPPGREFYLAPWYLCCILLGMVALVAVPRVRCRPAAAAREGAADELGACAPGAAEQGKEIARAEEAEGSPLALNRGDPASCAESPHVGPRAASQVIDTSAANFVLGLAGACFAGLCSASQFGVASKARSIEESAAGCDGKPDECPPALKEQFNNFGSWMTSFGIGATLATAFFLGVFFMTERIQKKPVPGLHLRVLWLPGSIAGICWTLGNFFQLAAVMRGGPTIMAASNNCFQLVTSGAWGLLYYREVRGVARVALWVAAAAWTVASAVLLSGEKAA